MRSNDWTNEQKREMWLSARPTRNPIIEYLRDGWDAYDNYGSTLGCLFAIADVMHDIDPALVPKEWEFRQSPLGADTESWEYNAILEALQNGATLEHLEHAAKVFERLDRLNRLTGLEY